MNSVETKTELAFIAYLQTIEGLEGVKFYAGHGEEEKDSFPRVIVTCVKSGGDLVGSGIFQCDLTTQGLDETFEAMRLSPIKSAIEGALCEAVIPNIKAFINAPTSGPDERTVKGYALSGIAFIGSDEGRDPEKNLPGFILVHNIWAALMAE